MEYLGDETSKDLGKDYFTLSEMEKLTKEKKYSLIPDTETNIAEATIIIIENQFYERGQSTYKLLHLN